MRRAATTEKPLLLLDVDGVLCPFEGDVPSNGRVGPDGYERIALEGGLNETNLWISRENAKRLARLAECVHIVWATG